MLSKTSIVIMGTLTKGEKNAYDILKMIDRMNMKYWLPIGATTLYETCIRLEKKGLIKDTGENHDELRAFADKIGYQHLQGIEKYKRKDTLPNIYNILRKKFPNEFKIISGLFNEDN